MVCVPCFIIPVLLYVWHRWVQPIMLRYWNPWAVRDEHGNVTDNTAPAFPFQCAGGQCPFPGVKGAAASVAAVEAEGTGDSGGETKTTTTTEEVTDASPIVGDKKRD